MVCEMAVVPGEVMWLSGGVCVCDRLMSELWSLIAGTERGGRDGPTLIDIGSCFSSQISSRGRDAILSRRGAPAPMFL